MHFAFCTWLPSEARPAYPVHVSDGRIMQHPVNPVTLNFAPRPPQGVELGKLDGGQQAVWATGRIPYAYSHTSI